MSQQALATIGVRLIALAFTCTGITLLVGNVLESAWDFNPNYLGYYFATQWLRPVLTIASGLILHLASKRIGRILAGVQS
jgi:hypothetical protein